MALKQKLGSGFLAAFVLGLIVLSADASRGVHGVTVPADRHRPILIHHVRDTTVNSYNWSGYAVTAASGSVTDVKGSWVVPAVQPGSCSAGTTNEYASFWVGIDGFTSSTVEQIGTDSDCQNGVPTYYAWFEFYPHPGFIINSLSVQPGDVMEGEVQYNPATRRFTVAITNLTTGQSFSTSTKVNGAQRSSAEWIAEAPSSSGGVLPLADFGTAKYGMDNTGAFGTSDATVSGTTAPIGAFGGHVYPITMVSASNPSVVKAVPSSLSSDGSSFSDTWVSSGP